MAVISTVICLGMAVVVLWAFIVTFGDVRRPKKHLATVLKQLSPNPDTVKIRGAYVLVDDVKKLVGLVDLKTAVVVPFSDITQWKYEPWHQGGRLVGYDYLVETRNPRNPQIGLKVVTTDTPTINGLLAKMTAYLNRT